MDTFAVTRFELDDGILLRRFTEDDAEAVFAAVRENIGHLREFMHWALPDYSLAHAREFIESSNAAAERGESLGFGIFRGADLIGSIGFVGFETNARRTEVGYWIDKGSEGKGIISRSCRVLINYAFGELEMNRIEIRCSTENERSARIPERFGFTLEGVLRQSEMRNGRMHDFAVYGLLRSEWQITGN